MCLSDNDPATPQISTLSLHDALPISRRGKWAVGEDLLRRSTWLSDPDVARLQNVVEFRFNVRITDRKSTRLNSSHVAISYAVFCLKKKNQDKYLAEIHVENEWSLEQY